MILIPTKQTLPYCPFVLGSQSGGLSLDSVCFIMFNFFFPIVWCSWNYMPRFWIIYSSLLHNPVLFIISEEATIWDKQLKWVSTSVPIVSLYLLYLDGLFKEFLQMVFSILISIILFCLLIVYILLYGAIEMKIFLRLVYTSQRQRWMDPYINYMMMPM